MQFVRREDSDNPTFRSRHMMTPSDRLGRQEQEGEEERERLLGKPEVSKNVAEMHDQLDEANRVTIVEASQRD